MSVSLESILGRPSRYCIATAGPKGNKIYLGQILPAQNANMITVFGDSMDGAITAEGKDALEWIAEGLKVMFGVEFEVVEWQV